MAIDGLKEIVLTPELMKSEGLEEWAARFNLGTAGYRDQLDPLDPDNPRVAFNRTKVAIVSEAKARVSDRLHGRGSDAIERHVGGEVRPHTQEFIEIASRVYAAHGHRVHLRRGAATTPIWYSSFGVFYQELTDGENFTASHSPSFKGGWKPMNGLGKQLLGEAALIAEEVRTVARPGVRIRLAPIDSPLIVRDFDVTEAYCDYLASIIPETAMEEIRRAQRQGFTTYVSTLGGSMAGTTGPIFERLGIRDGVRFIHGEEDSSYHGLGILDGVNHGVDPGKWQIYKNLGAQEVLFKAGPGHVFFIWDPDGDRFNMITTAPSAFKDRALAQGLEAEDLGGDLIVVYFMPNQIYFMLTLSRIDQIRRTGDNVRYDWIVAETFPTSRSIGEVAEKNGLKVVRTPVGFKYFGEIAGQIEAQMEAGVGQILVETPTGERLALGRDPRVLIMAEESGGAAMGGSRMAVSRTGLRKSLVMKEKDGFQIGLAVMALAARLYLEKRSFAEFYVKGLEANDIVYRHYERLDVTLYEENLPPERLPAARAAGIERRDRIVGFFKALCDSPTAVAERLLKRRLPGISLPPLREVRWAGDGTLLEFEGMWWELRASGTDAVLRYYVEGRDREKIRAVNRAFVGMEI